MDIKTRARDNYGYAETAAKNKDNPMAETIGVIAMGEMGLGDCAAPARAWRERRHLARRTQRRERRAGRTGRGRAGLRPTTSS